MPLFDPGVPVPPWVKRMQIAGAICVFVMPLLVVTSAFVIGEWAVIPGVIVGVASFLIGFVLINVSSAKIYATRRKREQQAREQYEQAARAALPTQATLPVASNPVVADRVVEARQSGNYRKGNRNVRVDWRVIVFVIVMVPFMFVFWPIGAAMMIGLFVWAMRNSLGGHHLDKKDVERYEAIYRTAGGLPHASVGQRYMEPVFVAHSMSASSVTDQTRWVQAIWERYEALLGGREIAVAEVASRLGLNFAPSLSPADTHVLPSPAVLTVRGSVNLFQVRNVFTVSDGSGGEYPVMVADLVGISQVWVNRQPAPRIVHVSTYGETWFPSDYRLAIVAKDTRTPMRRLGFGDDVTTGDAEFDKRFSVQTDNMDWASLVLTPPLMSLLLASEGLRLFIDDGRLTVQNANGWLDAGQSGALVKIVRGVAYAARTAEA